MKRTKTDSDGLNRTKRTLTPTEDWEQKQLIQWCRTDPRFQFLFHIPNESIGGYQWIARNRQMGCKKGVPDLFYPVPMGGYHGLFIEMKKKVGGVVDHEQKKWLKALGDLGYRVEVCKGWEAAKEVLLDYVGGERDVRKG